MAGRMTNKNAILERFIVWLFVLGFVETFQYSAPTRFSPASKLPRQPDKWRVHAMEESSPEKEAAALRKQALVTRLEAERMDAELTLDKIAKLERQLEREEVRRDADKLKQWKDQLDILSGRLLGEDAKSSLPKCEDEDEDNDDRGGKKSTRTGAAPNDTSKLSFTDEERAEAIEGFSSLPSPIRDLLARSMDLNDGSNATAVISALESSGKLRYEDGVGSFELEEELFEIFEDPRFLETAAYVSALLPESTRKVGMTPTDEDVNRFYAELSKQRVFEPVARPQIVPGGVILRGENRMKDARSMVMALDQALAPEWKDKLQFFYIKDPTPYTDEQFDAGEEIESPVLLILGPDISQQRDVLLLSLVNLLGVGGVLFFVLGCIALNDDIMQQATAIEQNLNQDSSAFLSSFSQIFNPFFFSICLTQFVHEAAHWIVATKDKFKIQFPVLIPSLQLGLTSSITSLQTSPPNLRSLFDFALAGPLAGMAASLLLLFSGLDLTSTDLSPRIPLDFLRLSTLAGSVVEWKLGGAVSLAGDPKDTLIGMHPFAIAGYVGILVNALSLLPIGSTDGGRISQTLFGRGLSRLVQGVTLFVLLLSGLVGFDDYNIFLFYAIYAFFAQRETEIPCRNEVDELDFPRVSMAIAAGFLATLALVPMT